MEIKILEKGLDYSPIQNKTNKPELRGDFEDLTRLMTLKWYCRNELTSSFSERLSFIPKCSWKTLNGNPRLELFVSQIEKELFEVCKSNLGYSNFSKEERQCRRCRSIFIRKSWQGFVCSCLGL